jgi:hypothetical protein
MAMTYTVLTGSKDTEGSIKYFVRHSLVPSDSILVAAQGLIYSLLRCREMKTRLRGSISASVSELLLPADFMEPVSFWLAGDDKLKLRLLDEDHFESRLGTDSSDIPYAGIPTEYTADATKAYFNATTDKTYLYRLWYMAHPAILSGSNETNFLTSRYPHILEAMCKYYAYTHRENDGEATQWLAIAKAGIDTANGEYDLFRQSIQNEMFWDQ